MVTYVELADRSMRWQVDGGLVRAERLLRRMDEVLGRHAPSSHQAPRTKAPAAPARSPRPRSDGAGWSPTRTTSLSAISRKREIVRRRAAQQEPVKVERAITSKKPDRLEQSVRKPARGCRSCVPVRRMTPPPAGRRFASDLRILYDALGRARRPVGVGDARRRC